MTTESLIPSLTPTMVDMLRARWGRCYVGPAPQSDIKGWPERCVVHNSMWQPKAPLCSWATKLEQMASDLMVALYPTIKDQVDREWRRRIERLGGMVPRFCDVPECVEFGAYSHLVAGGVWMDLCRCHALAADGGFASFTA